MGAPTLALGAPVDTPEPQRRPLAVRGRPRRMKQATTAQKVGAGTEGRSYASHQRERPRRRRATTPAPGPLQ